jgi:hypothetical protein
MPDTPTNEPTPAEIRAFCREQIWPTWSETEEIARRRSDCRPVKWTAPECGEMVDTEGDV